MLVLFQILFCIFALFAITGVMRKRREGLLGMKGLLFWVVFWVLATGIVLWPDSASLLASTFGIGRGADFIVYIALAVLFYVLFKLHIKLESIGRDITKVVRDDALKNHYLDERKKK